MDVTTKVADRAAAIGPTTKGPSPLLGIVQKVMTMDDSSNVQNRMRYHYKFCCGVSGLG